MIAIPLSVAYAKAAAGPLPPLPFPQPPQQPDPPARPQPTAPGYDKPAPAPTFGPVTRQETHYAPPAAPGVAPVGTVKTVNTLGFTPPAAGTGKEQGGYVPPTYPESISGRPTGPFVQNPSKPGPRYGGTEQITEDYLRQRQAPAAAPVSRAPWDPMTAQQMAERRAAPSLLSQAWDKAKDLGGQAADAIGQLPAGDFAPNTGQGPTQLKTVADTVRPLGQLTEPIEGLPALPLSKVPVPGGETFFGTPNLGALGVGDHRLSPLDIAALTPLVGPAFRGAAGLARGGRAAAGAAEAAGATGARGAVAEATGTVPSAGKTILETTAPKTLPELSAGAGSAEARVMPGWTNPFGAAAESGAARAAPGAVADVTTAAAPEAGRLWSTERLMPSSWLPDSWATRNVLYPAEMAADWLSGSRALRGAVDVPAMALQRAPKEFLKNVATTGVAQQVPAATYTLHGLLSHGGDTGAFNKQVRESNNPVAKDLNLLDPEHMTFANRVISPYLTMAGTVPGTKLPGLASYLGETAGATRNVVGDIGFDTRRFTNAALEHGKDYVNETAARYTADNPVGYYRQLTDEYRDANRQLAAGRIPRDEFDRRVRHIADQAATVDYAPPTGAAASHLDNTAKLDAIQQWADAHKDDPDAPKIVEQMRAGLENQRFQPIADNFDTAPLPFPTARTIGKLNDMKGLADAAGSLPYGYEAKQKNYKDMVGRHFGPIGSEADRELKDRVAGYMAGTQAKTVPYGLEPDAVIPGLPNLTDQERVDPQVAAQLLGALRGSPVGGLGGLAALPPILAPSDPYGAAGEYVDPTAEHLSLGSQLGKLPPLAPQALAARAVAYGGGPAGTPVAGAGPEVAPGPRPRGALVEPGTGPLAVPGDEPPGGPAGPLGGGPSTAGAEPVAPGAPGGKLDVTDKSIPPDELAKRREGLNKLLATGGGMGAAITAAANAPPPSSSWAKYWGSLDGSSKFLAIAGVSIAGISLLKSMFSSGDDDEEDESFLSKALPFIGIGAAAWGVGGGTLGSLPSIEKYKQFGNAVGDQLGSLGSLFGGK